MTSPDDYFGFSVTTQLKGRSWLRTCVGKDSPASNVFSRYWERSFTLVALWISRVTFTVTKLPEQSPMKGVSKHYP